MIPVSSSSKYVDASTGFSFVKEMNERNLKNLIPNHQYDPAKPPSSLSDWSLVIEGWNGALRCVNRRRDAERVGGVVKGSGMNPASLFG